MLDDELPHLQKTERQHTGHERPPYFHARDYISRGDLLGAFDALHLRGCIRETSFEDFERVVAWDYASAYERGLAEEREGRSYTSTVLCTIGYDCELLTRSIRAELKRRNVLEQEGVLCDRFSILNWTMEQKANSASYDEVGLANNPFYIRAACDSEFLKAGNVYATKYVFGDTVTLSISGSTFGDFELPLNRPETFDVYRRVPNEVELSVGDKVTWASMAPSRRPGAFNPTYRLAAIVGEFVQLTPESQVQQSAYAPTSRQQVGGLLVPTTSGLLQHAYCQTPETCNHTEYNCIFSFHAFTNGGQITAEHFRTAVASARNESFTYTHDIGSLRETLSNVCRQDSSMRQQAERHAVQRATSLAQQRTRDTQSLDLDKHSFTRGGIHHER